MSIYIDEGTRNDRMVRYFERKFAEGVANPDRNLKLPTPPNDVDYDDNDEATSTGKSRLERKKFGFNVLGSILKNVGRFVGGLLGGSRNAHSDDTNMRLLIALLVILSFVCIAAHTLHDAWNPRMSLIVSRKSAGNRYYRGAKKRVQP
ncbi:unnamed protein product [Caenorhabditis bovis]|uniref:Uncharacterized protein n=1 Tax=Caenorhabditis bovis TaxID=2654633 RepID=A0A8S1EQQ9_9PELO|nr:unnamed protein product [Caenorhabditis bovis]